MAVEGDRKFEYLSGDTIKCSVPCDLKYIREVFKSKSLKGMPLRCVAPGAALRGQHHAVPTVEAHENKLPSSRGCEIYNISQDSGQVDSNSAQV